MKLTAPVRTDTERTAARQRILEAAIVWVYDQRCSNALAELEEAVTDLIGYQIGDLPCADPIKSPF